MRFLLHPRFCTVTPTLTLPFADPRWTRAMVTRDLAAEAGFPEIGQKLESSLLSSKAPATVLTYKSWFNRFIEWYASPSLCHIPAPQARNLFLCKLTIDNLHRSLPIASAALSFFLGSPSGPDKDIHAAILESAAREAPAVVHRSKISLPHYRQLIQMALNFPENWAPLAALACIITFRAMLRIGETLALKWSDLHVEQGVCTLTIRRSKTDQTAVGASASFSVPVSEPEKYIWDRFFNISLPPPSSSYIFQSHSTGEPLTRSTMSSRIGKLFEHAGLGQFQYTTHSFRGGRASLALEEGVDGTRVRRAGRWRTESAFQSYIRPSPLPSPALQSRDSDFG